MVKTIFYNNITPLGFDWNSCAERTSGKYMDHQSFFRDFNAFRGWLKYAAPTALRFTHPYRPLLIWLRMASVSLN